MTYDSDLVLFFERFNQVQSVKTNYEYIGPGVALKQLLWKLLFRFFPWALSP